MFLFANLPGDYNHAHVLESTAPGGDVVCDAKQPAVGRRRDRTWRRTSSQWQAPTTGGTEDRHAQRALSSPDGTRPIAGPHLGCAGHERTAASRGSSPPFRTGRTAAERVLGTDMPDGADSPRAPGVRILLDTRECPPIPATARRPSRTNGDAHAQTRRHP